MRGWATLVLAAALVTRDSCLCACANGLEADMHNGAHAGMHQRADCGPGHALAFVGVPAGGTPRRCSRGCRRNGVLNLRGASSDTVSTMLRVPWRGGGGFVPTGQAGIQRGSGDEDVLSIKAMLRVPCGGSGVEAAETEKDAGAEDEDAPQSILPSPVSSEPNSLQLLLAKCVEVLTPGESGMQNELANIPDLLGALSGMCMCA